MLKDILSVGYSRYYNTITQIGKVNKSELRKIILATVIYKILTGEYGIVLNESDYSFVNKLLSCIGGSCLVPYGTYCNNGKINKSDIGIHKMYIADSSNEMMAELYLSN